MKYLTLKYTDEKYKINLDKITMNRYNRGIYLHNFCMHITSLRFMKMNVQISLKLKKFLKTYRR